MNPEGRVVQLVHSGRAGLVAGPLVEELVHVLRQVAPHLVTHDTRVVSVGGCRVNVHFGAYTKVENKMN